MIRNNMTGGVPANRNNLLLSFILGPMGTFFLLPTGKAQDRIPACPPPGKALKMIKPLRGMNWANDTIAMWTLFPSAFRETRRSEITDSIALLTPVSKRLRQVRVGLSEDAVRILHIGNSRVCGHIYPQATGTLLKETFDVVSYADMGMNGTTCLVFTHPGRITDIAAIKPKLLILSFGAGESHDRRYSVNPHYNQIDELVKLLHDSLPDIPILLTMPPGPYESSRRRWRKRTYAINPRMVTVTGTIRHYAKDHHLLMWDMCDVVGGKCRACTNRTEAKLMRPDHIHYSLEGYIL